MGLCNVKKGLSASMKPSQRKQNNLYLIICTDGMRNCAMQFQELCHHNSVSNYRSRIVISITTKNETRLCNKQIVVTIILGL